ncbi:MAG TPA: T9SS type A sorting domain-containing protein [Sunxiuqinia sp.]|nr:T9SS type A sorting domain-containing protein [Sunxiuqinia sp.]
MNRKVFQQRSGNNTTQTVWIGILALVICLFLPDLTNAQQTLAFPSAEGHGAYTTGGRGGAVIEVTNLNDSGAGSLRAAIEAYGPRTVVFRVSGTIRLKSRLSIKNSNITIAGQTAPGDGICLRDNTLTVDADNVIIRYIRSRLGDVGGVQDDAMNGRNHKNIIIDHCSMSWSVDEAASFYDNANFTMQWCIVSESLWHSIHEKGNHGYGGIWGGMKATFHHNLIADHTSRNPRFCGARYHLSTASTEIVDFRNNVIYNWGFNSAYGGESGNQNMVNNYYKYGPATSSSKKYRIINPSDADDANPISKWYVTGNYVYGYPNITADNWSGGVQPHSDVISLATFKATDPFPTGNIQTETAEQAYESVLKYAGANFPKRDTIDTRVVEETRTGQNQFGDTYGANTGIIDTQASVGGWPILNSTPAPTDSDHDGMPDDWEDAHSLNKNDATDRNTTNADGYTNLEVYLNSLVANSVYEIPTATNDLRQNLNEMKVYPNPVNGVAQIHYQLAESSSVAINVVDLTGRNLKTILNEIQSAGLHQITWNSLSLENGLYLIKLQAGSSISVKKILVNN